MSGIPAITTFTLPGTDELPANTASWQVDPERALLLVHDMQGFFLRPFPAESRASLVHNATLLRDTCTDLGVPVAFTAQPGDMTPEERGLLRDFWGPGMRRATEDQHIEEGLAPGPGDRVYTKWRYSAFFRSSLLADMREAGRDQIVLCGIYAHIGVLSTAIDAFTHDIQPFFVADATGDFTVAEHRMALDYVAGRCGVVTTTATVLEQLAAARTGAAR